MARRSPLDTEIQRLYALPLGDFIAARNELAKRLRKEKGKDGAGEVAALPKPSVSAWAVNHLFTVEAKKMDALLRSGEDARKALGTILSGGDPEPLRDAIRDARDLVSELREKAVDLLTEDGKRPGHAIVDRIATNLQSLAFSPDAQEALQRGWLDVDLPPPGFEVLAGLQVAALPPRAVRPAKPVPQQPVREPRAPETRKDKKKEEQEEEKTGEPEKTEKETAEQRKARETAERTEREETRRREQLAKLQARREEAAGRADFLRRTADKAEQTATKAEEAADEARQRAEESRHAADDARKRADEAERALAKAEKAVSEMEG